MNAWHPIKEDVIANTEDVCEADPTVVLPLILPQRQAYVFVDFLAESSSSVNEFQSSVHGRGDVVVCY